MRKPKNTIDKSFITKAISYRNCPAKTYKKYDPIEKRDKILAGQTVFTHCSIVALVADEIIKTFPEKIQELFPTGSSFIAGCHDIGKVSPYFYQKIVNALTSPHNYASFDDIDPSLETGWGGHAGVSEISIINMGAQKEVGQIAGQHHGFSPSHLLSGNINGTIFGGEKWQKERENLVNDLKKSLSMNWPDIKYDYHIIQLISGLTSVADWIGSGEYFEDPTIEWKNNIGTAVKNAGFIPLKVTKKLSFESIFGFSPNETQNVFLEKVNGTGVYILEAPMGLGKTEAALYAAYKILEKQEARGIYFALPTQLTSNKIYERFSAFINKISTDNTLLLHGSAWMKNTEMGEEGQPGGSWFEQSKRGLLAPFAVGTLDQAIMACMNVKHGFVRAFGLAGKVVILDEVHTYDAYTGTILNNLVELLFKLKCTVIILSATLNETQKKEILQLKDCYNFKSSYPLITSKVDDTLEQEGVLVEDSSPVRYKLRSKDEQEIIIDEVIDKVEKGEMILWIENTVAEAQEIYKILSSRCSEICDVGLLHSKFTYFDREKIEQNWISKFGKGGNRRSIDKNSGCILVGTQVLEQSLDIDADFLITKFCPTDMLLQRIGRLWRHKQTTRPPSAKKEAIIIAPNLDKMLENENIKKEFGNTYFVYSPYVLCRSLEVWNKQNTVTLPKDIRPMIEKTYSFREESDIWQEMYNELLNGISTKYIRRLGIEQLKGFALQTISKDGRTLPESKAFTRYSEEKTKDILIVLSIEICNLNKNTILILLDKSKIIIPHSYSEISKSKWKKISIELNKKAVLKIPSYKIKKRSVNIDVLEKTGLKNCFYFPKYKDDDNEDIIDVFVLQNNKIYDMHLNELEDSFQIRYSSRLGLETEKVKNKERY